MKIYLSSVTPKVIDAYLEIFPESKLNVLISFAFVGKSFPEYYGRLKPHINSLILDSGAFTLNGLSEGGSSPVTFERYYNHLKRYGDNYNFVFSFDRYFDDDSFSLNMKYHDKLLNLNLPIVPVVHNYTGGDAEALIARGDQLVALGYSDTQKNPANIKAVSHKLHAANKLVHALGVSNYSNLISNPIAYCDSTTWNQPGTWRVLHYWSESITGEDKTEKVYFQDWAVPSKQRPENKYYHCHEKKDEIAAHLKDIFGYDYEMLNTPSKTMERNIIQIHYFQKLQEIVTENHRKLGWNF